MLIKLVALMLVVLGVLVVYAALKPAEYVIAREVTIQATPEKIFPFINTAKEMDRWMPWADMDSAMTMSYQGPEAGVGSRSAWSSTGKMGVGSSTIIESIVNQSAKYALEYEKPFAMKQTAEISIRQQGSQSIVRWSVAGRSELIGRFMCIFMNMDKMVGTSFEKGLAKLKKIIEGQ